MKFHVLAPLSQSKFYVQLIVQRGLVLVVSERAFFDGVDRVSVQALHLRLRYRGMIFPVRNFTSQHHVNARGQIGSCMDRAAQRLLELATSLDPTITLLTSHQILSATYR